MRRAVHDHLGGMLSRWRLHAELAAHGTIMFGYPSKRACALADNIAKSYEDPKEVVDWYLNNPQHKAELAAVVVENNVVAWILKNAQVKKEPISFENLMGRGQQA